MISKALTIIYCLNLTFLTSCSIKNETLNQKVHQTHEAWQKTKDKFSSVGPNVMKLYRRVMILQMFIDSKELQKYLHPEVSGRSPLVFSTMTIGEINSLSAFGKPVEYASERSISGAFIRVTKFEISYTKAIIDFEYPIEGIKGTFHFNKEVFGGWKTTAKIVEN